MVSSISLIFLPYFRAGDMEHLQRAAALPMPLELRSTIQGYVSLLLSILLHYFQLYPNIFCQKNFLKVSLQFPAGDMQLLGWRYLCRKRECGDLRH
jgi:hypothetical protein